MRQWRQSMIATVRSGAAKSKRLRDGFEGKLPT
jgi:hypothetical protein